MPAILPSFPSVQGGGLLQAILPPFPCVEELGLLQAILLPFPSSRPSIVGKVGGCQRSSVLNRWEVAGDPPALPLRRRPLCR